MLISVICPRDASSPVQKIVGQIVREKHDGRDRMQKDTQVFFLHLDFVETHTALFWHTKEYGDWNADPGEREEDHKEESKPWVTAAKRETI